MALLILAVTAVLALLVVLDVLGKLNLSHPVWVFLTALGYFASVVYTAFLVLLALAATLSGEGSIGIWLTAAVSILPGTLFGIYVLVKSNFFPLGRKGGTSARKVRRVLDCGLILAVPLQVLVIGGYVTAAVAMGQVMDGPWWLTPFYPLVLAVLWPMAHLAFHVALVAWMLDPIILLVGLLIGLFWTASEIFLVHGTIRGILLQKRSVASLVGRVLLSLVPVVNLVLAVRLRVQLGQNQPQEVAAP